MRRRVPVKSLCQHSAQIHGEGLQDVVSTYFLPVKLRSTSVVTGMGRVLPRTFHGCQDHQVVHVAVSVLIQLIRVVCRICCIQLITDLSDQFCFPCRSLICVHRVRHGQVDHRTIRIALGKIGCHQMFSSGHGQKILLKGSRCDGIPSAVKIPLHQFPVGRRCSCRLIRICMIIAVRRHIPVIPQELHQNHKVGRFRSRTGRMGNDSESYGSGCNNGHHGKYGYHSRHQMPPCFSLHCFLSFPSL